MNKRYGLKTSPIHLLRVEMTIFTFFIWKVWLLLCPLPVTVLQVLCFYTTDIILNRWRLHRNSCSCCHVKGRNIGLVLWDNFCGLSYVVTALQRVFAQLLRERYTIVRGKYSLQKLRGNFLSLPTIFQGDSREIVSPLSFPVITSAFA